MAQTPNQKKPNHSKPPLPKQPNRSNIVTLVVFLAVGIFFDDPHHDGNEWRYSDRRIGDV